jgi:2-iminobutanoate/2-iminopropanoate deaminase
MAMDAREPIFTVAAPAPAGAYSQAIRTGDYLFLAGQGPFDAEGNIAGESIAAQVRQVLSNLAAVADAGGGSLQRAVRIGVYLSDLRHFKEMDAVYREIIGEPRPARTTIQSNLTGMDVEADAVIWLGDATSHRGSAARA